MLIVNHIDQQANDTGRQINTETKIKKPRCNKNRCLGAIGGPFSLVKTMADGFAAPPNPQPNWVNRQAWLFPPDMAAVYAIQRSKKYDAPVLP